MTPETALLRTLADNVPSMLAYWDSTLRCRFANRAYERWFGVSPEAIIGKHISEVLGPIFEANRPYIEGALRGEAQEFERAIPNPAGGPPRASLAQYIPHVVDGVVEGFFVVVTDVSALKRTEASLRESEQRFRLTIDEAPIGMALVATDGRFIRVNRALCDIVGYAPEELTGLTFQAITHPDDLDADLTLVNRLARGEIPRYQLEKRYLRKDGAFVEIMLSVSVVRAPDGAPLYFIAQIEDISEAKRAERALRESQERFEFALDGADLASWDWNIKTGEAILNPRWAEMRGYRPDEIEPRVDSWTAGVHPDDWPAVKHALDEYFAGRTPIYETRHRVRCKSGAWLWILDRGKVFARDEEGRPARMVGTELDITERKQLEDEQTFLADVGRILAGSLDADEIVAAIARLAAGKLADCAIVDLVEDGDRVRRITVNCSDGRKARTCEALKRFPLDRRRAHLASAVLETKQPTLIRDIDDLYLESIAQGEEHLALLRDLGPRSMIAVPLIARERLLGALLLVSSTSTRRYGLRDLALATELARRAALALDNARLYETARHAIEVRDEVLGVVAHDLRNPLSAILMRASLLGEAPAPDSGEMIVRAARRMSRLIEDLLDVTRMDAGRLSVKHELVPTRQLASDAFEAQQPLAASAGIRLRIDVPIELPPVWGDRDRLLQIVENLMGNAIRFTPRDGEICLGAAEGDGAIVFSVADTGAGIAPEDLPHLFDRFYQAPKERHRGAGLGLAIVKGLVEAHGGRIWVESAPGRGTTFFFTIPTAARAADGSALRQ